MSHPPQDPRNPSGAYGGQPPQNNQYFNGQPMPNAQFANEGQYPSQNHNFQGQPNGQYMQAPGYAPMPPEKKKSWFARHKILTALLVLILLSALGKCAGGSKDAATTPSNGRTTTGTGTQAAPKTTQAAAPAMAKMNQVVHYNTYDFTVTSLKCGATSVGGEYNKTKAQGQFCMVGMTVKNTGTKAQTFMANNQKLLDAKGTEYSYSTDATIAQAIANGGDDVWVKEINPGNTAKGILIFDMPKGAKPVKIHVSDGGFTDQGTDIALS